MSVRSEFVRLWNEFMASGKKISQLPAATTPLAGTEEVELNQGGTSVKTAVTNLPGGGGGGSVDSVSGPITDNTDPTNPIVGTIEVTVFKTASAILAASDAGKLLEFNVATPNTVTFPLNATVAIPVNSIGTMVFKDAATTVVKGDVSIVINSSSGDLTFPAVNTPVVWKKTGVNEWYLWNGTAGGATQDLQDTLDLGSTAVITSNFSIAKTGDGSIALGASGVSIITVNDPIVINAGTGGVQIISNSVDRIATTGNNNDYLNESGGFHRFYSQGQGGTIRLMEESGSGSNYIALKAPTDVTTAQTYTFPAAGPASNGQVLASTTGGTLTWVTLPPKVIQTACSDETTALTTGTKVTFRMPYAMTLTAVRASLTTAQASGSIFTVDIQEAGVTVLSTLITIDNTEKTSTTAAAAPVISDSTIADDAEITIIITQIGASGAAGLKVSLIGT